MPKVHQLLAVQENVRGQAPKIRLDLKTTLEKKSHLFGEKITTFFSNTPNVPPEKIEQSSLATTVLEQIQELNKFTSKAIDIGFQLDLANAKAGAKLIVDGKTLAENVPPTALLQIGHRLAEIKEFVSAIPTLDPAKGFKPDPDRGAGIYKAREVKKERTQKKDQPIVVYEATKEHPAQAVLKNYDVPVGHIIEQEWSSLITPALKSQLLDRIEEIEISIKEAKSVANDLQLDTQPKVGQALLDYIYQPLTMS